MNRSFFLFMTFAMLTGIGNAQLPVSYDTINPPLKYWRQLIEQPDANLFEIRDLIFDFHNQIQHPEAQPDFKSFNRHFMLWKDRVGTNEYTGIGNYKDYIVASDNVSKNFTPCSNDNASWTSIGPFNNLGQNEGLVSEVFEHPNDPTVRLIGTPTSGIWKLNNSNNLWENVTDNLGLPSIGVNEIIVNPFDDNQLFAATGNFAYGNVYGIGVLLSNDKGITWSIMPGYFYDHFTELVKIVFDESDSNPSDGITIYAISRKNIFKTTDSGVTWTLISNPVSNMNGLNFFDIISNSVGTIFISTEGSNSVCYYSNDGGNTWNDISSQFGTFSGLRFSSNVETSTIYCCFDPGSTNFRKVAKSTDNGLNWTVLPFQAARNTGDGSRIIEHSSLTGLIYLDLGNSYLQQFNDAGLLVNLGSGAGHADTRDIQFIPSTTGFDKFLRANDGGISIIEFASLSSYTHTDLNGAVLPIGEFYQIGTSEVDSDLIIAGHIHNGVRKLDNGIWSSIASGDGHTSEINPYDANFYYYRSNSTTYRSGSSILTSSWYLGAPMQVDPGNPNFIYAATGTPELKRFDENTDTWSTINNQIVKPSCIGISEASSEIIYLGQGFTGPTGITFVKSTDFGATWIDLSNNLVHYTNGNTKRLNEVIGWGYVNEIIVDPFDPNKLWITNSGPYTENGIPVDEKERVLMSEDGGQSWIDYSEGLSSLPAIALVQQKGTNDRLFIGTDAGVFYRDANMSQWECYSNGLPRCVVVDLDINHCTNELILSSHGRGIWKTPINLPMNNAEISASGSWTGKRRIYNNLLVEAGNTLTLTGEFYFGENTGITIKPGGKLDIQNATLTSGCGTWWKGIQAVGEELSPQTTIAQPLVKLNNATIENAYIAIRGGNPLPNNPDQTIPFNGGAIVQVNNSTFRNNWIDIQFMPFHRMVTINNVELELRNLSFVKNSHFITDADLTIPNHIDPFAHIQMTDINGIDFRNNIFESTRSGITKDKAGIGIYALDAKFNVLANCTVPVPVGGQCPTANLDGNEFKELYAGIYTGIGTGYSNIKVDGNLFEDCVYGIYMGGTNYNTITRNTFKIPQGDDSFADPITGFTYKAGFGMYMQSAFGNKIEENIFENANTTGPHRNLGIYSENGGVISGNTVFRNDFTNLTYGAQTVDDNQLLDIDCNRFYKYSNTFADIHHATGFLKDQGFCHPSDIKQPNANEFYGTCDNSINFQIHKNPSALTFEYNSYDQPDVFLDISGCVNPSVNAIYCNPAFAYNRSLACPSTLILSGVSKIPLLRSTITLERNSVTQLKSQIDGGDTENLISAINSNMNSGQLKNLLMQYSPYLSDKVLISAINRVNPMSPAHLKQILLDNSPLTEAVLYNLSKNPLSQGHMNQILNAQIGESARSELDDEIRYHDAEKLYALNELVGIYLDTNWVDSALVALQSDGSIEAMCLLLPIASKKDTLLVENHIEMIRDFAAEEEIWYPLSQTVKELQTFCDFHEALYNIKNRGGSYFSMKQEERNELERIAQTFTSVKIYARSVLDFTRNIQHYFPDQDFIYDNGDVRLYLEEPIVLNKFKAYPNPFENLVTIEYNLEDEINAGYILITDIAGKELTKINLTDSANTITVPLEPDSKGVYIATLFNKGSSVQSIKLISF